MEKRQKTFKSEEIHKFLDELFGNDLHAKRVLSLSNAALGVITNGAMSIHAIGQGLSFAKNLNPKHSIKQVDRLFGNSKINVWELFKNWVPYVIGNRDEIFVALDWTDFDKDDQTSIVVNMITSHGRATPLIWKTVKKSTLKGKRNDYEDEVLSRLHNLLPNGVKVTVTADRGFGDQKLYDFLTNKLEFNFIIRFKEGTYVTNDKGEKKKAIDWLGKNGRTTVLKNAKITDNKYELPMIIVTKKKDMKDTWCLAVSKFGLSPSKIIKLYGKRWGIETSFRDIKDYRFGMGMSMIRTKSVDRRDKLFLLSALVIALLTILGAAGDSIGLERTIKANTSKTRTYSFFRQGCIYYQLLQGMKEDRFKLLMEKYCELLVRHKTYQDIFGFI